VFTEFDLRGCPGPEAVGTLGRLADPGRVYVAKILDIVDQTH